MSSTPKPPKLEVVPPEDGPIPKPKFNLDRFKSSRAATIANVGILLNGLPHHRICDAEDFVRLHTNELTYWSDELCFVNVPTKGAKRDVLHLVDEDLATQYLQSARIKRFRLALATKPHDRFFLCHIPTQNLDNLWNETNLAGCNLAKTLWVEVTSRGDEGVEAYKTTYAREQDAFPNPQGPTQSLIELIEKTFDGRTIDRADHPGLLRLIGAKPVIS
jgi:hypothetical protein